MYQYKTFSQPFTSHYYNYHDYMRALYRAFYIRNFNVSWFFHFHHKIQKVFPLWSKKGLTYLDLFQKFAQTRAKWFFFFLSCIPQDNSIVSNTISNFFTTFSFQWIIYWEYVFQNNKLILASPFKVKWWSNYIDLTKLTQFDIQE